MRPAVRPDEVVDLRAEAAARKQIHGGKPSHRPFHAKSEIAGLAGEAEFSRLTGLPLNWHRENRGDGGPDFWIPLEFGGRVLEYTLDVKTSLRPEYLLHATTRANGKPQVWCHLYVLAGFDETTEAVTFIGWETGRNLRAAPTKMFLIMNHYIDAAILRDMDELLGRYRRAP